MPLNVPPTGFAGLAQMTPASRAAWGNLAGGSNTTTRRRRRKATRKKTAKRAKSSGRKIKFGSPAWRKKYKLGKKK